MIDTNQFTEAEDHLLFILIVVVVFLFHFHLIGTLSIFHVPYRL